MEFSITAVTASRKFPKALIRIAPLLEPIRTLELPQEGFFEFEILQLVFMDRDPGMLQPMPNQKRGRLRQIQAGIPDESQVNYQDDQALFAYIRNTLERAIVVSGIPALLAQQFRDSMA
jgi:hypothetical protein